MGPRFSVVLPLRDRADDVARAMASVLAQTFVDVELVVVDMGSQDRTLEAIDVVADRRVRVFPLSWDGDTEPSDSDVRDAVDRGLEACRGRHVTVVDPDTAVRPHWLARCGLLLDRSRTDVVYCGGTQHHIDGSTSAIHPLTQSTRPGAVIAPVDELHELLGAPSDPPSTPRAARTPEPLIDWYDDRRAALPEGDELRLRWAIDAVEAIAESPIPDVTLLSRYATYGGVVAARLRRHAQARHLFAMAHRIQPSEVRPLARWMVASVPPLADRVWNPAAS